MGAGVLPVALYRGRLYFLFGKENRHADTPGWADFGGGNEPGESDLDTAVRECSEELTGFLGDRADIKRRLLKGPTFVLKSEDEKYVVHCIRAEYDEALVHYFNANQRFLQERLDPVVYKKSKLFEKSEIGWFSAAEMKAMRPKFRIYYRKLVDQLFRRKGEIAAALF
jgi:8-oxo-dGTP pyrophosphatase MutT (NUDIX family)